MFPFIPKLEQLVCWFVKDSAEELEDEVNTEFDEERLRFRLMGIQCIIRIVRRMKQATVLLKYMFLPVVVLNGEKERVPRL